MSPKILMFGWEFPPHNSGGLGTACLGLTKALSRKGVPITFVLPKKIPIETNYMRFVFPEDEMMEKKILAEVLAASKTAWGGRDLLGHYATPPGLRAGEAAGGGNTSMPNPHLSIFDEVHRYSLWGGVIAKNESFDVIYAHDWLCFGAGIAAKKATGKPLIVQVHATEFDRGGGNDINQDVYDAERLGMTEADHVIAVSQFTKNIVTSRYGIPEEKVTVVHNGIDEDAFLKWEGNRSGLLRLKEAGKRLVLFVGRLTLQKGPDYFLRAAQKVIERDSNTIFIIAGSGDMERKLIEEVAFLGISDRVLFAGFLRGQELFEAYRLADLFVMPSVSEPFGIVPLEAISSGAPVIISKQSGVKEVLRHALSVDFWDVDELADKILGVVTNAPLHNTMTKNLEREVLAVTWDKAAGKVEAVVHRVLGK